MKITFDVAFAAFIVLIFAQYSLSVKHNVDLIIKISDFKEFKKYLRTHTNVIVIFSKTAKDFTTHDIFNEVAHETKGIASVVHVDCSVDKKFCKKLKVNPTTVQYKHFKDGEFHKSYDRKLVVKSLVKFLQNPTGDIPWDEEPGAENVVHVEKKTELFKIISKEKKPILAMFYAPWCGFCKKLKPDFAAAATALKGKAVLLGMDVDTVEGGPIRMEFNITGFPTIIYFKDGKREMNYGGENTKDGIIKWMNDPQPPKEVEAEKDWSEVESDVVHLGEETFNDVIQNSSSALVMFYAPWCGHCKKMKPEYEDAAATMREEDIPGILAAVDATKHPSLATRFSVKGYPTVKYFKDGKEQFDNHDRTKDSIVAFMKDPKEPPPPPPVDLPWSETPSSVEHLDEQTFKNYIKKKKHALIIFYAPWCGHCKKAKPEFMAAAEEFKDDPKVAFAAVDCTKYNQLCQSHGVSGYPTFKYFNYGKSDQKYLGGREKKDFVDFMRDPSGSIKTPEKAHWNDIPGYEVITILKEDNFDAFIQKHENVVVTFYGAFCSHCQSMRKDFVEAVHALKEEKQVNVEFAAVDVGSQQPLSHRFGVTGLPTIKMFSNGKERLEYEGERTTQDFINLVLNPPPLVVPFANFPSENIVHVNSLEQIEALLPTKERVLVFFYDASNPRNVAIRPEFWDTALNVPEEKFQLAAVDCPAHYSVCQKYSVRSYPTFKLFVHGEFDSNFDLTNPVTKESLLSFLSKEIKKETPKIEL